MECSNQNIVVKVVILKFPEKGSKILNMKQLEWNSVKREKEH